MMETRHVGSLDVSLVGLGCNNFGHRIGREQSFAVIEAAFDAGVTFFDTADVYGHGLSEQFLGEALGTHRDEVILATKFGSQWSNPKLAVQLREVTPFNVRVACEDSLRRLGSDHIDLYQLHTPEGLEVLDEILATMLDLREQGKVREIGCSQFTVDLIDWSVATAGWRDVAGFASVQNQWNLLHRAPEVEGVIDACIDRGLAFIPYFPLAGGMLTGKYVGHDAPPAGTRLSIYDRPERFWHERNIALVDQLEEFARSRGHSIVELAMSWLASHVVVGTIIAGATKPEQVRANTAAPRWRLSDDELEEIDCFTSSESGPRMEEIS